MRRHLDVSMEARATPEEKDQKDSDKHADKIHKAIQAAIDAGHDVHVSVAGKTVQATVRKKKAKSVKRTQS